MPENDEVRLEDGTRADMFLLADNGGKLRLAAQVSPPRNGDGSVRPILAGVCRHAGEKRIFLGVVTALVTAALVAPALAGDNRAQKVDFLDVPSSSCFAPPATGTPDQSFAIINRNPAGNEVTVQVQLKDALPNTTYRVEIWVNGCDQVDFYRVTTNNQGNENARLLGGVPGGTTNDVVLTARAPGDSKQTPKVTFGP